jgi:FkbM family methyltransferase
VNLESVRFSQTQGESVLGLCVDDLVDEYCENRRIGFIKVDAQAFEKYALRGLLRTITRYKPKIFFEIAPHLMFKAEYDYPTIEKSTNCCRP